MTPEEEITQAILGYYSSARQEIPKLLSGFSSFEPERIFRWTDKQESLIWEIKSKWPIRGVKVADAEKMHEILLGELKRGVLCNSRNESASKIENTNYWSEIVDSICSQMKFFHRYELSWTTKVLHWCYPDVIPAYDRFHAQSLINTGYIFRKDPRGKTEIKNWLDAFRKFAIDKQEILGNIIQRVHNLNLGEDEKIFVTIPFVGDFYLWFQSTGKQRRKYAERCAKILSANGY